MQVKGYFVAERLPCVPDISIAESTFLALKHSDMIPI